MQILQDLKLRWFDPTQCFCDHRIDKGIVEGLMLKRAKCTIYLAQESDTLGKDSELAATLAQGKPVIAFVPELEDYEGFIEKVKIIWMSLYKENSFEEVVSEFLPIFYPKGAWENEVVRNWVKTKDVSSLEEVLKATHKNAQEVCDRRANQLKNLHPLGLQVNLQTGVTNGVIVVRKVKECAQVLRGIMLCDLDFIIEEPTPEHPITRLREKITNSVFRVVTEDDLLTNSFWNFWRETLKI